MLEQAFELSVSMILASCAALLRDERYTSDVASRFAPPSFHWSITLSRPSLRVSRSKQSQGPASAAVEAEITTRAA